jgi:hypothetical protein
MANTAKNFANFVYALVVGLAAASLAIFGPILVAFVAASAFDRLGLTQLSGVAAKVPKYFTILVVFGVAVGLTTCLRVLGRRFRKDPEPPRLK